MITVYLEIKGKVQGVFFRATARKVAEKNNLSGWIRNKSNGDVEAVVTGKKEDSDIFIKWCKEGPRDAEVKEVNTTRLQYTSFKEFSVKR